MVSREWAREVVEQHLAAQRREHDEQVLVVTGTEEHRLGWLVFIQGERYARTRAFSDMLIGTGYFLVDNLDGSLHHMHASADLVGGGWIDDYLEEVRGIERPDLLRIQIGEFLRSGDRLAAIRAVRAVSAEMDPAAAKRYVDAVGAGAPIPDDVEGRLPKSPPPMFAVRRPVTGPNPEPAQ